MLGLDPVVGALDRVAVVGVGLLGGSLGLALRQAGYAGRLIGVVRRAESLADPHVLRCLGPNGRTVLEADELGLRQALAQCPLIVLATPLQGFPEWLSKLDRWCGPATTITDVGSVKAAVQAAASALLRHGAAFAGAHPMAGKETQGPSAAEASLFLGKPCVLTPSVAGLPGHDGAAARDLAALRTRALWKAVGARLLERDPAEHDRQVAVISHAPHALASLLMDMPSDAQLQAATPAFHEATRLAGADTRLWMGVFLDNRAAVIEALDAFLQAFHALRQALARDGAAGVEPALWRAAQGRRAWIARRPDLQEGQKQTIARSELAATHAPDTGDAADPGADAGDAPTLALPALVAATLWTLANPPALELASTGFASATSPLRPIDPAAARATAALAERSSMARYAQSVAEFRQALALADEPKLSAGWEARRRRRAR